MQKNKKEQSTTTPKIPRVYIRRAAIPMYESKGIGHDVMHPMRVLAVMRKAP